jgi:hypothetical protein
MKGSISKGSVGRVRDMLAENGIDAPVQHVEGGTGFNVRTEGLSARQRALVQRRLEELGITESKSDSAND